MSGTGAIWMGFDRAPGRDFGFTFVGVSEADFARFQGLAADARAVVEAFERELEAGPGLKPAQHASLLALKAGLTSLPDPMCHVGGTGYRPPRAPRPAADVAWGEDRHGYAMGRPGA